MHSRAGRHEPGTSPPAPRGATGLVPGGLPLVLLLLLLLLSVRLGALAVEFATHSLQMDFASYYTAGRAMDRGLSPYVNHVDEEPPLWDGVDRYRHSRFLYPPLAARLFQALSLMPYATAKSVWMIAGLLATAASLLVAGRMVGVGVPGGLLYLGVVLTGFFPVAAMMERGQIDGMTLLLIVIAMALWSRGRRLFLAGILLALATLLKLHVIYLVPFLVFAGRWRTLAGLAAGGAALLGLNLLTDPGLVQTYTSRELPRISFYGESGTRAMQLPAETLQRLRSGVPRGKTLMDGRVYDESRLDFSVAATLVRTPVARALWSAGKERGVRLGLSHLSLAFLVPGAALLLFWQKRHGLPGRGTEPGLGELIRGSSVLTLILLTGPSTWAMNTVWLLPVAVVLYAVVSRSGIRRAPVSIGLAALGLALAGVPDGLLAVLPAHIATLKYVAAESLCLCGLLGLWRQSARGGFFEKG